MPYSQFNRILTSDTQQRVYIQMWAHKKKKNEILHILWRQRKQTDIHRARRLYFRVTDSSARWLKGRVKKNRSRQREKEQCIPTLPYWRHLSPPEADCHSGTQQTSSPKPWGQPLTQPRWTPLCSSCEALLHCPQPALSICTFKHNREACVTHSGGLSYKKHERTFWKHKSHLLQILLIFYIYININSNNNNS